ncbi:MAG: Uma2 family endonuclease [Firmicutes bacterium]|nr:Uma2 family endonuclease [Bacillota bacterium]
MYSQIYDMAVYPRHSKILERIGNVMGIDYSSQLWTNSMALYRENSALAYKGDLRFFEGFPSPQLYNVNDNFISEDLLAESRFVQPDYMIFYENKVQESDKTYKMAGCPDLIIEVWSNSNTADDRLRLCSLYSTSETSEFWQFEQNSNTVLCSKGKNNLPSQSLTNLLFTQNGLKLDLTSIKLP